MKILVLGAGAQGRVIASDLARSRPGDSITVADVQAPRLAALPNLRGIVADLSDEATIERLLREHDLGVGALPSHLGTGAMRAAIAAGRNLVDVSFAAEDALDLDGAARGAGVTIVPDCGLAPGLSHLIVGRMLATGGKPDELNILVGGVAADPRAPYGYVVTWAVDDLLEEYVRPARVVRDGRVVERPAFDELERIEIDGVGEMEAFLSDGLRTLLFTVDGVPTMSEKTLRWPGHVAAVRPLVDNGTLVEEFRRRCVADPARDLVVMSVRARRGAAHESIGFVSRHDEATGLTAMSRTTALTTSVVAQLAAEGGLRVKGVTPLEIVARDAQAYEFIVRGMAARGVDLVASRSEG